MKNPVRLTKSDVLTVRFHGAFAGGTVPFCSVRMNAVSKTDFNALSSAITKITDGSPLEKDGQMCELPTVILVGDKLIHHGDANSKRPVAVDNLVSTLAQYKR